MKFIDFLFYYLVKWFEKRRTKFKKIVPIERAIYGIGITIVLWLMCVDRIFEFLMFKSFKSIVPNFAFVIIAFFVMWLLKYIYITKKRYDLIITKNEYKNGISEKAGTIVALIYVFLSFLIPMFIVIVLHKFDSSL